MAQHARTTQLLGVDFLPLGDAPVGSGAAETTPAATQQIEAKPSPLHEVAKAPRHMAQVVARGGSGEVPDFSDAGAGDAPVTPLAEVRAAYASGADAGEKLGLLRDKYESDAPHQRFNTRFTNIVFGEGDPGAELMFVGEAPGEQEDLTGRPFVGRAGQLLEKMIVAMGLSRETVYICNVLKTRPPNNATPTQREAALCAPYLLEQIRIISPRVIVTLGLPATHLLLHASSPMRAMRGQWHAFPPRSGIPGAFSGADAGDFPEVEVMPTYHPAYLLRSYTEDNRRKVWSDLRQVMDRLGLG